MQIDSDFHFLKASLLDPAPTINTSHRVISSNVIHQLATTKSKHLLLRTPAKYCTYLELSVKCWEEDIQVSRDHKEREGENWQKTKQR